MRKGAFIVEYNRNRYSQNYYQQRTSSNMNNNYGSSGNYQEKMPIGMCYVPWQVWGNIYEPHKALICGTVFEDLNKPFLGGKR